MCQSSTTHFDVGRKAESGALNTPADDLSSPVIVCGYSLIKWVLSLQYFQNIGKEFQVFDEHVCASLYSLFLFIFVENIT